MALDQNNFHLSPEQLTLLGQFSARTGKPPEEVLSDALRQYQSVAKDEPSKPLSGESLFDKLNKKGLIGCLSGGPPDLSTNPKYMEGFGE
jgi:hypothetical protein